MKQEQIIKCGGQKIKVFNCDPEKNTQCDKEFCICLLSNRMIHTNIQEWPHRRILTSSKEVEQDGGRPEYQRNND